MLGEELLDPSAEDSAWLVEDNHRPGHRPLPPVRSDPLGTDPAALGEIATPLDGQALRERQELADARVGYTVHHMSPPPPGAHKATPLQACKVIRNPASRGAGDRDELRDRSLSSEQRLEHAETRGVPQDPEVPCSRGQGRRGGIAMLWDRPHSLTYNRFSC
jgi:hypothetical protein